MFSLVCLIYRSSTGRSLCCLNDFFGRVVKSLLYQVGEELIFLGGQVSRGICSYPLVIYYMRSFKENKYDFCRISKVEQGIDIADKPQVKSHDKKL